MVMHELAMAARPDGSLGTIAHSYAIIEAELRIQSRSLMLGQSNGSSQRYLTNRPACSFSIRHYMLLVCDVATPESEETQTRP